uniref:Iroquois homeobox 4 n=1 Tax=Gopherus agassizii TaxID=38772 RepID=A0A452GQA9_9SAUR
MSFSQFGYPYSTTSPSTTCCETASRSVPDVSSGSAQAATLCCPSYENRLLASTRTELNAALGMYSSPYSAATASQGYANYLPYSTDPSTLYTTLYEIKDGTSSLHSGFAQPAAFYPYDPSLGQYQYDRQFAIIVNFVPLPRVLIQRHFLCKYFMAGMGQWISVAQPGAKMQLERQPAPLRPGCTNTEKTLIPPKGRKSCWPSLPK